MLANRIIPCLDIKDGRTVKGVNFANLKDAGDPVELARQYAEKGADELVFLDISATLEGRETLIALVEQIAKVVDIPFTVGGGIGDTKIVGHLLAAGADKVSVNSAAFRNPDLIPEISNKYGSQCLVIAIDANLTDAGWTVHTHGGTRDTGIDLFAWAKEAACLGAGEILFTSMNADGTKGGFAIEALDDLSRQLSIPVIASGGAGSIDDFVRLFQQTRATGALAASVFHFGEIDIGSLKSRLFEEGIPIRPQVQI